MSIVRRLGLHFIIRGFGRSVVLDLLFFDEQIIGIIEICFPLRNIDAQLTQTLVSIEIALDVQGLSRLEPAHGL